MRGVLTIQVQPVAVEPPSKFRVGNTMNPSGLMM